MAKTFTHAMGPDGKPVIVPDFKPTKAQRKSLTEMPWTPGPGKSKLKRLRRDLFG